MPSTLIMHASNIELGEYRDRARTMSPSILRKLRRVSAPERHAPHPKHGTLQRNNSLQDHSTIPSSGRDQPDKSLLIGILKKSTKRKSVPSDGWASSSCSESSTEYLNEEIAHASHIERDPLPRGSEAFEQVMTELGSREDVANSKDMHTGQSPLTSAVKNSHLSTQQKHDLNQIRKVHWDIV